MSEKYELIAAEEDDPTCPYPVVKMCLWLQVSTSGFYDHEKAGETDRSRRRATITVHVQAAHTVGRGTYGVRRVHQVLARSHDLEVASCSIKLVRSVMAGLGLSGCQPRAYKTTTQSDPDATGQPADLLGRNFTAERPGTKLVGDITYIRTWAGWLYLATVIDCCTRQVIGWSMADHMRTSLVCDALSMAAGRGGLQPGAIFHSDRGSQGGFNWSSQHFDHGGVRWDVTRRRDRTLLQACGGSGRRIGRCGRRCVHLGGRSRLGRCSGTSGGGLRRG